MSHAPSRGCGRVDIKAILANPEQRRALIVPLICAIQAREGIETTLEQAVAAYDKVCEETRLLKTHRRI